MHGVFFDIGKVPVDFDYDAVTSKLSQISDRPVNSGLTGSAPLFDAYHRGTISDERLHQYFIDVFGTTRDFQVFEDSLCSSFSRIEAGLGMLSTMLATPGVRVGIISDNHEICTRWLARETPELFKSHTIILSQQVGGLKPEPVMYESALKSIGLPADACIFIDDREPNIIRALGYGMKGIVHKIGLSLVRLLRILSLAPLGCKHCRMTSTKPGEVLRNGGTRSL